MPEPLTRRALLRSSAGLLVGLAAWPVRAAAQTLDVAPGASIQAAVDRVAAGGTVRVAPGIYDETVVVDKPLHLLSAHGPQATLLRADPARFSTAVSINDFIVAPINVVAAADVTVEGFALTGGLEGFWSSGARRLTVTNCLSFGNTNSGFYFWASQDVVLEASRGEHNAVGVYQGNSVSVDLLNNAFSRNVGGFIPHLFGVDFPGTGILASNNASRCTISGNRCFANADSGIQISRALRVEIAGNQISANPVGLVIKETDTQVHGNNVFGNARFGLQGAGQTEARENWWGDPSGPSGEGSGTGDAVQGAVFDPWLRAPAPLPG